MISRFLELEQVTARHSENLTKLLRGLDARSSSKDYRQITSALLLYAEYFEALAQSGAEVSRTVGAEQAEPLRFAVDRALKSWQNVTSSVEELTVRAVRGHVSKEFRLISVVLSRRLGYSARQQLNSLRERLGVVARGLIVIPPAPEMTEPTDALRLEVPGVDVEAEDSERVPSPAPGATHEGDGRARGPARRSALDYPALFQDVATGPDGGRFEDCLRRLLGGDTLDLYDALADLLRRHQHQLVAAIIRGTAQQDPQLEAVMNVLWRHADVVLMDDYFFSSRRTKLTSFLALAEPHPTARWFAHLLAVFTPASGEYGRPADLLAGQLSGQPEAQRSALRAALVHPLEEFRVYAANQLEVEDLWGVVSFPKAPAAALFTVLERLTAQDVPPDHCKVFFDCTLRSLAAADDEVQVAAARQCLNLLFQREFFMEDEYFRKLLGLNTIVEERERHLGIESTMFRESLQQLKALKASVGVRGPKELAYASVPPVVLRKLAREGFHSVLLAQHADPRIALETLPYVSNPARAESLARLPTVHQRVLAELAKQPRLFRTQVACLELVRNPRATLRAVLPYLARLSDEELSTVVNDRNANPEVRAHLRSQARPGRLGRGQHG